MAAVATSTAYGNIGGEGKTAKQTSQENTLMRPYPLPPHGIWSMRSSGTPSGMAITSAAITAPVLAKSGSVIPVLVTGISQPLVDPSTTLTQVLTFVMADESVKTFELDADTNGTNKIDGLGLTQQGFFYITDATPGDYITVMCATGGNWVVVSACGNWASSATTTMA